MLSPKRRDTASNKCHCCPHIFVAQNLVCFNKICSVSCIIYSSHFISLTSHSYSSSGNHIQFQLIPIYLYLVLITIPLYDSNFPKRCWNLWKILRIIQILVPPVSVIRNSCLVSSSQIHIKRVVKTAWKSFSYAINVIKLFFCRLRAPNFKELNPCNLNNFWPIYFKNGFLINLSYCKKVIIRIDVHNSQVAINFSKFLRFFMECF